MPVPRLLVIADTKMLPALANGLRDGGKFDVLTVPLADSAQAQAAAERADAVAVFYGAPDRPLAAAVQTLAAKVRDRGARLIAVLQREQAAQRDECFRSGASDLLFMPMPKDQFVQRLASSVALQSPEGQGAQAPVAVSVKDATSNLQGATITPGGVTAPGDLPLKAGETVRLSWEKFQTWGLVVRGGPSAQIRFAGLAPEEEAKIRDWLKEPRPAAAEAAPAPVAAAPAPSAPVAAPPPAAVPAPPPPAAASPDSGVRSAPAAGPPPGFADRKPVRPPSRTPMRVPPPIMAPPGTPAPIQPSTPPAPTQASTPPAPIQASTPPAPAAAEPAAPASNGAPPEMANLFQDVTPAAGMPPVAVPAAPVAQGPSWPVPPALAQCRAGAFQFFKDKTTPADAPAHVVGSIRKIVGMLGSTERAALEKAGPDSHFAEALGARVALDASTSEGTKLYAASPAAVVDNAAVAALTKTADDAAARLQKEANQAVSKGEVESLQLVTAASAALSRDLLTFKETADRLRGIAAAPRLGAGALDPEVILPGQQPATRPPPTKTTEKIPVRAELRDFQMLDEKAGSGKRTGLIIGIVIFVAALVNGVFFVLPKVTTTAPQSAGANVISVQVSDHRAIVVVKPQWTPGEIGPLLEELRNAKVQYAVLRTEGGALYGNVNVQTGQVAGYPKKTAPPPK